LGVEGGDGWGVVPGFHQGSGGVEFCGEPGGQPCRTGRVTQDARGLGDVLRTDERVTQSYLTASVAAYIGAIELCQGVGGGLDGVVWSAQQ
jgi:hypothetical protein